MKYVLYSVAAIALVWGLLAAYQAESAVHEIEALISFLTATVGLGTGAIVDAAEP